MRYSRLRYLPIVIFIISFIIPLTSLEREAELFSKSIQFLTDSQFHAYQVNGMIEAGYVSQGLLDFVRYWASFSYESMMTFGFLWFQILLIFIATIGSLFYFDAVRNEYQFVYYRQKKYKQELLRTILGYSLRVGIPVFLSYLIWNHIFSGLQLYTADGRPPIQATFLVDIFGSSFIQNNLYLYYIVEGFFKFFLFPVIYASLSCLLSIILDKRFKPIILVTISFFLLSSISGVLYPYLGFLSIYMSPALILNFTSYHSLSTFGIVFSLLCVAILDMVLFHKVVKRHEI